MTAVSLGPKSEKARREVYMRDAAFARLDTWKRGVGEEREKKMSKEEQSDPKKESDPVTLVG